MEAGTPPPPPPTPEPEPFTKTPQEAAESMDPNEKLEGVRAWVAQLDRKLQTRFLALGAASVLALAAGIVAVVLALGVQDDSATKSDLTELRDQVDEASRSASSAAEDDLSDFEDRLGEIESQLEGLRSDQSATDRELSVVQDDIADLRDQVDAAQQAAEDAQEAADAAAADVGRCGRRLAVGAPLAGRAVCRGAWGASERLTAAIKGVRINGSGNVRRVLVAMQRKSSERLLDPLEANECPPSSSFIAIRAASQRHPRPN